MAAAGEPVSAASLQRRLGLAALAAERDRLHVLRTIRGIDSGAFDRLQSELDLRELALQPEGGRHIAEV